MTERVTAWLLVGLVLLTAANALLAYLISTALGTDPTLGGLAEDLTYTGGATLFSETGSVLIGAVARFDLTYRHVAGSPY